MNKASCVGILLLLAIAVGVGLALYGPISQPENYHVFADERPLWGVPNAWNVLTNIPFVIVGFLGLSFLLRGTGHTAFESPGERAAYLVFFAGVFSAGFASAYYHLEPNTEGLFWDRLPITVGFSAFFCAIIAERISTQAARMLLFPCVALGAASVLMWRLSEQAGRGDLRAYLFVQIFPLIAAPLIVLLFRSRYSRGGEVILVVLAYAIAKAFEFLDAQTLSATLGLVSGHSIKHLVAAAATGLVLGMIKRRRPTTINSRAGFPASAP